ncbi:hypothetical protein JOQ06_021154, partial [Pogonophryne albipinna]
MKRAGGSEQEEEEEMKRPGGSEQEEEEEEEMKRAGGSEQEEEEEMKRPGGSEQEEEEEMKRPGGSEQEEEEEMKRAGGSEQEEEEEMKRAGGSEQEEEEEMKRAGGSEQEEEEEMKRPGGSEQEEEEEMKRAGGSEQEEEEEMKRAGGSEQEEEEEMKRAGGKRKENYIKKSLEENADQEVRAKPGEDVLLRCNSSTDAAIIKLEWSRPELKDNVFFFRDNRKYEIFQDLRYRGRVELKDPEIKNGDASVLLKNVDIEDTGTYECRVITLSNNRRKRNVREFVRSVHLSVSEGPEKEINHEHQYGDANDEQPEGSRGYAVLGVSLGLVCSGEQDDLSVTQRFTESKVKGQSARFLRVRALGSCGSERSVPAGQSALFLQ